MDITSETRMTYRELASALGVSEAVLKDRKYKATDFPKADHGHRYSVDEVCHWILRNTQKTSKLARGAEAILVEIGKNGEAQTASAPPPSAQPTQTLRLPGADFATNLDAFRQAVRDCHLRYLDALSSGEEVRIQATLKTWGLSLETLRKAEASVLEIERERGRLIPIDEVKQVQAAVWTGVKQKLLTLGARLAPTLVNVSSQKVIQDALETEARFILDDTKRRIQ